MRHHFALPLAAALLLASSSLRAQDDSPSYSLRSYTINDFLARWTAHLDTKPFLLSLPRADAQQEMEQVRERETQDLIASIKLYLEPKYREHDAEQSLLAAAPGVLVLRATDAQHAWVQRFFSELRQQTRSFHIETSVMTVLEGDLGALGLGDEPSVLGNAETQAAFLEKAKSLKQIDILQAPSIIALNGQRATMSTVSQTSYIKRYDEIDLIEPERKRIIDPVIDIAKEGLEWEMRALALPDGSIGLESELEVSELVRPIPQKETPYGKVSVPEVRTKRVQSTVRLRPGQALVLRSNPTDGKRLVLLLKATPIEPGDLEAPGKDSAPSERKR
jgi:hypothetical protein